MGFQEQEGAPAPLCWRHGLSGLSPQPWHKASARTPQRPRLSSDRAWLTGGKINEERLILILFQTLPEDLELPQK